MSESLPEDIYDYALGEDPADQCNHDACCTLPLGCEGGCTQPGGCCDPAGPVAEAVRMSELGARAARLGLTLVPPHEGWVIVFPGTGYGACADLDMVERLIESSERGPERGPGYGTEPDRPPWARG